MATMNSAPVVFILGAGPRIGASVAETFSTKGYKVAIASRKGTDSKTTKGIFSVKADLADPASIPALFEKVTAEFHSAPGVVIYNAPSLTPPPAHDDIFSIPTARFSHDLNVNTVSAYAAAQSAVAGWESLPKETKKTFIYTGNMLNVAILPVPLMFDLGVGKAASAYWIGVADATLSARGFRFFYADERQGDGKMKGTELDGPSHGEFYAQLAEHEEDTPWHATFVKGRGYVKF